MRLWGSCSSNGMIKQAFEINMCLHCASSPFDQSLCGEMLPFSLPLSLAPLRLPPPLGLANVPLHHCDAHILATLKFPRSLSKDARAQAIQSVRLRPAAPGADLVHEEVD